MWSLTFASSMSVILGVREGEGFWSALAWSGLIAYFFGTPAGFALTDLIFGYEVARLRERQVPNLNELASAMATEIPWKIQAISVDGKQGDIFLGLTPEQWQKVAKNVLSARDFTYATVGQTERNNLTIPLRNAKYLKDRGNGRYEPTDKLYEFFNALLSTPPPTVAFRKIIEYYL